MKPGLFLTAAVAAFAVAGCNGESGREASGNAAPTVAPVPPPEGGDWTQVVSKTPEGGYIMGNPNASVKLVEFASMTCPHCAAFDETGAPKLVENYVKTGNVSYEFRNFVMNGLDMAMTLTARCGSPERFFALTHALFENQRQFSEQAQSASPEQQQALAQSPQGFAQLAGLQTWAAQRGVPSATLQQCLTNQAEIERVVQTTSEAVSDHDVAGTPSFLINGELVEGVAGWEALEPKLKDALGG